LGVIIKSPSPPPLSHRARGDKIHPLPLGEGRGEGINLDILSIGCNGFMAKLAKSPCAHKIKPLNLKTSQVLKTCEVLHKD